MERYREIEKSIIKKYRKEIWSRFVRAIKDYELINEGDKIMVCISGGKDSFLLAKCMQEIKKHGQVAMARCRELFPRCASCGNAGPVQAVALRLKINQDLITYSEKSCKSSPCLAALCLNNNTAQTCIPSNFEPLKPIQNATTILLTATTKLWRPT